MTYNMTALQNADSMIKLLVYANDVATESYFMVMMLIAIWFIIFMVLLRYGFPRNALTASFICTILSSFLLYAKLINSMYVFGFFGLTIGLIVWLVIHPD